MKEFLLGLKQRLLRLLGLAKEEVREEVEEVKEEVVEELVDLLGKLGELKGEQELDVHDCDHCCGCQCCAHHHEEEQEEEPHEEE